MDRLDGLCCDTVSRRSCLLVVTQCGTPTTVGESSGVGSRSDLRMFLMHMRRNKWLASLSFRFSHRVAFFGTFTCTVLATWGNMATGVDMHI